MVKDFFKIVLGVALVLLSVNAFSQTTKNPKLAADVADILDILTQVSQDNSLSDLEKSKAAYQALSSSYLPSQYAKIQFGALEKNLKMSPALWSLIYDSAAKSGILTHLDSKFTDDTDGQSLKRNIYGELSECLTRPDQSGISNCASPENWQTINQSLVKGKWVTPVPGHGFFAEVMEFTNAEILLVQTPLCDLMGQGLDSKRVFEFIYQMSHFNEDLGKFGLHRQIASDMDLARSMSSCIPNAELSYIAYHNARTVQDNPKECTGTATTLSCQRK